MGSSKSKSASNQESKQESKQASNQVVVRRGNSPQLWTTLNGPQIRDDAQATADNLAAFQQFHTFDKDANMAFTTHPLTDKNLNATPPLLFYKVVSVQIGNKVSDKVAALLTLYVNMSATVSYSEHFKAIMPTELKPRTKYCFGKCAVAVAKFIGQPEDVQHALSMFGDGNVKFVSNFNSKCVYELGYEVEEKHAFSLGKGCLQGIHAFSDPESAKDWVNTGFINSPDMPSVSTPLFASDIHEKGTLRELTKNMLSDKYYKGVNSHLTAAEIRGARKYNVLYYKHNFDESGNPITSDNPPLFEIDTNDDNTSIDQPYMPISKRQKTSSLCSDETMTNDEGVRGLPRDIELLTISNKTDDLNGLDINAVICPLSGEIFIDPVIAADGHTYERKHIEEHLIHSDLSPITKVKLAHKLLIPNLSIKVIVDRINAHMTQDNASDIMSDTESDVPLIVKKNN